MSDELTQFLRESEERYRTLVETASDAILTIAANSTIIFVNRAVERIFGYQSYELVGKPLSVLLPSEMRDRHYDAIEHYLKTGEKHLNWEHVEIPARRRDGSIFSMEISFAESRHQNKPCFIGIARDITERKKTEQSLSESQMMLALAMRSSRIGAWAQELAIDFVSWSPELEEIFGLKKNTFGQTRAAFHALVHEDDRERIRQEVNRAIADHVEYQIEFRFYHADGSVRWMEGRGQAVYSETGTPVRVYGVGMDITERKNAEEISERYRLLSQHASDIILFIHPSGKIFDANQAAVNTYGYDYKTLLTLELRDLRAPQTFGLLKRQLAEAAEKGIQFETIHRRSDGAEFSVEVNCTGSTVGGELILISIIRDISERKRSEERLKLANYRFQLAERASHGFLYDWNLAAGTIERSEGFRRVLGYETGEIADDYESWLEIVHPDDLSALKKLHAKIRQCNVEETFDYAYRVRHRSGEYCFLQESCITLQNEGGDVYRVIGQITDETDRKVAEQALQKSEEQYRALFASIDEGFCVIEMKFDDNDVPIDYVFLETNPAFERQTGISASDIEKGRSAREMIPNLENFWFEAYGKVAMTGEALRFTHGSEAMSRWFDVYAFRIEGEKSRKVAILFNDVTARQQAEAEREQILLREQIARQEAEAANRAKDEFLSVLSHELRTPLNAVLGWTKMMQTGTLSQAQTVQAVETIERNARLQNNLIEDLLDVSRIISGKMRIDTARINFREVIDSALETVRPIAVAKNVSLDFQPQNDLVEIEGDATRLQQIVVNLANNAVKFTPAGGAITIRLIKKPQTALLEIADTGIGISEEFLPQIFDRFRQADSTTQRHHSGLGLGLTIVKHLTELHNGRIDARSGGENKGAVFFVEIPLFDDSADGADEIENKAVSTSGNTQNDAFTGKMILLVDDDCDGMFPIKLFLEKHGAQTVCVESATAALEKVSEEKFDLILSDIGMPNMDGYQFISGVREMPDSAQIPAIALTAYASSEDRERALEAGFTTHLSKPIDFAKLLETVSSILP